MAWALPRLALAAGLVAAAWGGALGLAAYRMLPAEDGTAELPGLTAEVTVDFDAFGVPLVTAGNHLDAYRALGYLTARDRLFQMDLARRSGAGTLAEILGESVADDDVRHRVWGFSRAAGRIVERLPLDQRAVLEAYVDGANAWIDQVAVLPFEFQLLGYRPARWTPADSLLVVLGMFEGLDLNESEERMLTVMAHALPPEVAAFLTPRSDPYRSRLPPTDPAYLPPEALPFPVEALRAVAQSSRASGPTSGLLRFDRPRPGSNAWAVAGAKTADGRAILANDMHLGLSVPNVWYRYALAFEDRLLAGVGLPGTPLLVAGTSRHLAWGLTALGADVLDLVMLETDPQDPDRYRTPDGWQRFDVRVETVVVKDAAPRKVTVRDSRWGPVSGKPLLGQLVAYRWTALDPKAVDLALLGLGDAPGLDAGLHLVNRAGGPPLNVVLADDGGRVAWSVMGRIPIRHGFDGAVSRSWADGDRGWERYVEGAELPRIVDPQSGFVASANDHAYGEDYPYGLGHGFDTGYRAYRIKQMLSEGSRYTETGLLALQLDTRTEHHAPYRAVAFAATRAAGHTDDPLRQAIKGHLAAWDGRADVDSAGLALLADFRRRLLDTVLAPFLQRCRALDAEFDFVWPHVDAPLQRLLTERPSGVLPGVETGADWDRFVFAQLQDSAKALQRQYGARSLAELTWGRVHSSQVVHPFSAGVPGLAPLLDMPSEPQSGCEFCVRFAFDGAGATERLVVSPGRPAQGILHMPGGQSGQPQSPHYRDQHRYWSSGRPLPLLAEPGRHRLRLLGTGRRTRPQS